MASTFAIYILISLYFIDHFYFRTEINGVNVSLKAHKDISSIISKFIKDYELQLLEKQGEIEVITGQDIEMQYNKSSTILQVKHMQNPLLWIRSLFKSNPYYIKDLYDYNPHLLDNKINSLKCLKGKITEPQNVDFKYSHGSYKIIKEVYGNKINKTHFVTVVNKYISQGRPSLDLHKMQCYENPKYTISSEKTFRTKKQLDRYEIGRAHV